MRVISITIQPPRKPNLLANAACILEGEGSTLTISDIRVLRNKQGVLWCAMPSYNVSQGRAFEYFPCVEPDALLAKRITDAVLSEYQSWEAKEKLAGGGG